MTTSPQGRVVVAAQDLFLARGYGPTSIGEIAKGAGVALQTIYSGFGSKVGLLAAVQDHCLAGDRAPIPMLERKWVQRLPGESFTDDLRQVVTHLAAATTRAAPINGVIRAAASDPGVAALLDSLHEQRIRTCQGIADRLVGRGAEARDLADCLYAVLGVECHDLLVVRRGWSRRRWERWALACLTAQISQRRNPRS